MERQLLELERQFWEASGDADFYRRRFADDGCCVFGFGTLDKDATIAAMESATPWTSFELEGVTFIELAPRSGALTYTASARRGGDDLYRAAVSSVYARRAGQWRLVLHHQTPRVD
jgi:hypothetical protein